MAIRIRVYPQPGSIGLRRRRAARIQQQRVMNQQYQLLRQQELLRQQQLQTSYGHGVPTGFSSAYGTGYGYGTGLGYGTGYGSSLCGTPITGPAQSGYPYSSQGRFPGLFSGLSGGFAPYLGAGLVQQPSFGFGW